MEANRVSSKMRKSSETSITVNVNLDGSGKSNIDTGVGFFDHMLTHLSKYSFIDMDISASGDLHIDAHHTVEDVGIVLGDTILEAFGDKAGINRYGFAQVPMDEVLASVSIDLSGRPVLCFGAEFSCDRLGTMDTELVEEFFRAFTTRMKMNCHVDIIRGKNNHHIAEGIFKALGKALDGAKTIDPRVVGSHSTKGMFD